MKNLHIIMPMAGEGSRFKKEGYDTPKPLIKFNDKELYRHALDSIDLGRLKYNNIKVKRTFIVRQEFIDDYNIDKQIKSIFPDANVISVTKTTRGSLETALLAEPYLDLENDAVLIMDSDIEFRSELYNIQLNNELLSSVASPLLLSFYSVDPRYSYARCEQNVSLWWAVETAEKNPISTHALTGCYFMGDAKTFVDFAKTLIDDFEHGKLNAKECFVSLIYNYYIKNIGLVQLIDFNIHIDNLWSYGTPEELNNYLNTHKNIWDK